MSGFDHAQLRLIEQMYVDGDDPFAAPEEDIIYMEVNEDAPQEEETYPSEGSAASEN